MNAEIVVQGSVREPLRAYLQGAGCGRWIALSDARVTPHAKRLLRGVPGGLGLLSFDLGERRKNLRTVEAVLDALVRARADRATTIVGIGGGVAADLFGFAASTFMRGVPYVHVATTLLAMVDAAIGGKTGVDLSAGKNLAGTFSEPRAVFAWVDALRTLPYRNLREGLAETVKHAIIEGGDFFEALETLAPHPFAKWPWEAIVEQSQRVKIAIVNDDRHERGVREVLNLGHTFGHAIEAASRYRVTHGAGVSIGLRAAGLLALRTGRFSRAEHLRVLTLLALLRMPAVTGERSLALLRAMHADKKRRGGTQRFVLPRAIGDVEYGVAVPETKVRRVLDLLRRAPGADEFR